MRLKLILIIALVLTIASLPIFIKSSHPGEPPTASFTYSPSIPGPGDIITFDASASFAPGGSIASYSWDFGDGAVTTTSNPIITHSYPIDGNYTVQLTVTDNNDLTGIAVAVIQVLKEVDFRVSYAGSVIPLPNAQVTVYYNNGTAWVPAPARSSNPGVAVIYDNMTQPNIVTQYRNPGFTASILLYNATNISFDLHSAGNNMIVFFKFQRGSQTAYWPDNTTTYYTYDNTHGTAVANSFSPDRQPYWDPAASTYVIKVAHIKSSECEPILLGILCPPPAQQYSLTVNTSPLGITTIPGQGLYVNGTNVLLTAPIYVNVSTSTRYRFNYWDVDGTSRGAGVNPITVLMTANHTATAHYITQYFFTVTSAYDSPTPVSGWFDSGTGITASVSSPVSGGSGIQYVCTGWTGTGSVPSSGSGTSTTFTLTQPSNITWNWKTQYYLTVTSAYGATGGQGWYDSGSTAYASVSPLTVSGVSGVQYVFTQWSGDASGTTSPSNAIVMNGPKTATANWKTQYYLTVSSAYDSPTPVSGWFDSGTSITASLTSPAAGSAGTQYVCTGWTGTGSAPASGGSSTMTFTITTPSSITWNWKTQYQVIFDQTGVGSDFTGTTVTIDGVNYSRSGLPTTPQFWWDQGSSHSFYFASPLPVNGGTNYVWNSTSGLSSLQGGTLTITTSGSVIGNYIVQNRITFDQTGVGSDFTGTVVIIDGANYNRSQLPISFPWTNGSLHTFAYQSPLIPSANTKYVWNSTTGLTNLQNGSITVTTYGSIIGNYKTQYYLTVSSAYGSVGGQGWCDSGSAAYATVSPLTVAGSSGTQYVFTSWSGDASGNTSPSDAIVMNGPKTATASWKSQYYLIVTSAYGAVGGQGWYDSGTTAYATVTPLIVAGSSGTQYVFTQWSGDASGNTSPSDPIVMTGPSTASANWKTQYYLTVSSVYGSTGGQGWYDSGATTYATITPLSVPGPSGTQYAFDYWSGDATGNTSPSDAIVMNGPKTANANWKTQYYLTVTSAYGAVGGQGWYDSGSTAYATVSPLTVSGPSGTQYVFTSWSGDATGNTSPSDAIVMNGPKTANANWKTQYYLSMVTDPPGVTSPSGAGWYDAGTNTTISTPAFVDITPGSSRYRFNGWTTSSITEIADPTRSPTTALMDEAKTITANYAVQYHVSFSQSGVGMDFAGTIVTVDAGQYNITSLPYQTWWDSGSSHTFSFSSPLIVTANSKQYVWNSTSGISTLQSGSIIVTTSGNVIGNYQNQYYLRVYSLYDSPNPSSGWFNTGTSINANVASVTTGPPGTRYLCTGWTGTGSVPPSGTSNSVSFTISQPSNITWNWKTQYYLTVETDPNGITTIPGEGWYDEMTPAMLTAPTVQNYNFTYWDVDGPSQGSGVNPINVAMNAAHTATAHYSPLPTPLTVSISPTMATIHLGDSVTFTSTTSGGTSPYSYQWILDSIPVPGATSSSWTFTPPAGGTYFVYLKVTDANNNTASSTLARIIVVGGPIGGYSVSFAKPAPTTPAIAYFAIVSLFGLAMSLKKRKRK
jgi:hypothetical protein